MIVLDRMLASGIKFVLGKIAAAVDAELDDGDRLREELLNDQPWKERLIELQMMLEVGDITEEQYTQEEAQVFQALRDIRARKEQIARQAAADRGEESEGIGIYTGYGE